MGLIKGLRKAVGSVSKDLLENGLLGRGTILDVKEGHLSVGGSENSPGNPVCTFTVEVALDNVVPYQAKCRQQVGFGGLGGVVPGQTLVAVRVNPDDHSEIAIDWDTEVPSVTLAQGSENTGSAAEVLAKGEPARAVIVQSQDMKAKNQAGAEVYAFKLTVMRDGQAPYQIEVGNPVPPEAVPLLFPGSNVPAKVMPDSPNAVVIDWTAALAEFTKKK